MYINGNNVQSSSSYGNCKSVAYSSTLSVLDRKNGLISTRYLMLMAHLILAVSCLMARDANVRASLPLHHTRDDYYYKDSELIIAMSLTISFVFIELLTFGTGLTMFSGLVGAYSIMCHGSGALLHAYFILDTWDTWIYWWIFSLTACLPLFFDLASILINFCLHNVKYKN